MGLWRWLRVGGWGDLGWREGCRFGGRQRLDLGKVSGYFEVKVTARDCGETFGFQVDGMDV